MTRRAGTPVRADDGKRESDVVTGLSHELLVLALSGISRGLHWCSGCAMRSIDAVTIESSVQRRIRAFIKGVFIGAVWCACVAFMVWLVSGRIDMFNLFFFGIGLLLSHGVWMMLHARSSEGRPKEK